MCSDIRDERVWDAKTGCRTRIIGGKIDAGRLRHLFFDHTTPSGRAIRQGERKRTLECRTLAHSLRWQGWRKR